MGRVWAAAAAAAALAVAQGAQGAEPARAAQDRTTAGAFTVERPTLVSLGFHWRIEGDDNRNAQVEVAYRKKGEAQWRPGLPLMRTQNELVGGPGTARGGDAANPRHLLFRYRLGNLFSGSLLNLQPDTEYEARFTLSDPDGVKGPRTRTEVVRTRAEPAAAPGGRVFHVYPVDWTGPKQQPAFTGLMEAYFMGGAHFDYSNAFPPRVQPGDVILVHAGLYVGDRRHYLNGAPKPGYLALGNYFDGTYYLTQDGTAEKPIVIKGAGDGEVIFDGDGAQTLFNLMGADHNHFEGITVRNTNVAFLLGIKDIAGASGFALQRSKVYDVGRVVQDDWSGSKDFYIADNDMTGRHAPDHMMGWLGAIWAKYPDFPELLTSEYAVKVYGQGHVVAHNRLSHWHDAVDVATYGVPDGAPGEIADRFPESIDIYGNDAFNMGDNCFEADGGGRNIRVFANRCFNTASQALSVQPGFGGPFYFFRNLVFNAPQGSLKYIEGSSGILTFNNTIVGEAVTGPTSNETYRNNLFLAQSGAGPVFSIGTFTNYSSADHDGFRPNPGAAEPFGWASPPFEVRAEFEKPTVQRRFPTLQALTAATGQERHGVLVDFDVFAKASAPDPTDPRRLYFPDQYDFRLRPGSAAVDAGTPLPTITDGFTGAAPDLGVYELGKDPPLYGPRPK